MEEYDICIIAVREDAEAAQKLADSLRSYRLPSGTVLPDASLSHRRIFVDAVDAPFDDEIAGRFDRTRCLVVMCSPETKTDEAVNARLDYFRARKGPDHIIAVLLRGEPMDAFPGSFIEKKTVQRILPDMTVVEREERIEPVASDLRGDTPARRKEMLNYETVRIVASVLGLHPDALEQRHRRRRRRAITALVTVIVSICLGATGLFLYLGHVARTEGEIAEKQTQLTVEIARRTMEELPAAFEGDEQALYYIGETIDKTREALEELGLTELLEQPAQDEAEENGGGDVVV
ncbi:MAG: hypothetical protein IJH75_03195 [Mogibacterium sp.]|nr:hypothetical protein [Mogibacterium sp.]